MYNLSTWNAEQRRDRNVFCSFYLISITWPNNSRKGAAHCISGIKDSPTRVGNRVRVPGDWWKSGFGCHPNPIIKIWFGFRVPDVFTRRCNVYSNSRALTFIVSIQSTSLAVTLSLSPSTALHDHTHTPNWQTLLHRKTTGSQAHTHRPSASRLPPPGRPTTFSVSESRPSRVASRVPHGHTSHTVHSSTPATASQHRSSSVFLQKPKR